MIKDILENRITILKDELKPGPWERAHRDAKAAQLNEFVEIIVLLLKHLNLEVNHVHVEEQKYLELKPIDKKKK